MLSVRQLSASVNKKIILDKITFDFEEGKIYAIMGPNGSGKSTLAYTLMGHPSYQLSKSSKILLDNKNIVDDSVDERARKGLFLSFQQPLPLAGVRVSELLQLAVTGTADPLDTRNKIIATAKELGIPDELLERSLNDGASGGEKKKLEVLQAAVLNKRFMIFDEVDTGVDVDALKTIAQFLNRHRKDKTYIVITHYNRILKYLKPDKVLIIRNGRLVKVGDHTLAHIVEQKGYDSIKA